MQLIARFSHLCLKFFIAFNRFALQLCVIVVWTVGLVESCEYAIESLVSFCVLVAVGFYQPNPDHVVDSAVLEAKFRVK